MKLNYFKTLLVAILVIFATTTYGETYSGTCGTNVNWSLDTETGLLKITGTGEMTSNPWNEYNNYIKSVKIEDGITTIGYDAFAVCLNLATITIPGSVTTIEEAAFYGCENLTSVIIENGVKTIGVSAFEECLNLTTITIPASIIEIEEDAFFYCPLLTSINVSENNPKYSSIDGVLFNKEKTVLIQCPNGKEGEYIIPNSVKEIGDHAFICCLKLTSVSIGSGTTSIGYEAFGYCENLTSITIPNSVTYIDEWTFGYCENLTSITIPNSVTSIGSYAFSGCSSLTEINIPNSVTYIGGDAFYDTSWYNNQSDGLIYIGKTLYKYKGNMPENSSVNIKEGTVSIGARAFGYCENLTSITIPNSVTYIGEEAFYSCTELSSITIPESVTYIGGDAFYGTSWYNNQSDGLIYIGKILYKYKGYMPENSSVNIKEGTVSIGARAFQDCENLTSITIPESVTYIGWFAFLWSGLTEIYSLNTEPANCDKEAFFMMDENINNINVYIPYGTKSAYQSAFEWNKFTNFIECDFTGIEDSNISATEIKVIAGNGIDICNYYGKLQVINIAGQVIKETYVNGSAQITLPKGIYIVVTENKSQKVVL